MSSLHREVKELWILLMDGLISFYHEATEREGEREKKGRERGGRERREEKGEREREAGRGRERERGKRRNICCQQIIIATQNPHVVSHC